MKLTFLCAVFVVFATLTNGNQSNRTIEKAVRCSPQVPPKNGFVNCSGNINLTAVCSFDCAHGYELVGNQSIECIDNFNNESDGIWTGEPPTCKAIGCLPIEDMKNQSNIKLSGNFSNSITLCEVCSRYCPLSADVDLVFALDCSSLLGDYNWNLMKDIIKEYIEHFQFYLYSKHSRFAIFRYNKKIDYSSQILFNSHLNNESSMLEAIDRIPYDQYCNDAETRTGQAIQHINDVILKPKNGNEEERTDVVIIITVGITEDRELLVAELKKLENNSVLVYFINIKQQKEQKENKSKQLTIDKTSYIHEAKGGVEEIERFLKMGTCPCLRPSLNTEVTCTYSNKAASRCTFVCKSPEQFTLRPPQSRVLTCLETGEWDKKTPFCIQRSKCSIRDMKKRLEV